MDGVNTILSIPCGAGAAAVGLYALMSAGDRATLRWIGWSLYALGGVVIAGTVLESTGSFWNLFLFCLLSAAALICLAAGIVRQSDVGVTADLPGAGTPGIRLHVDVFWFSGAVAAVATILAWHGNYWTCGALLASAALLGFTVSRAAFDDSAHAVHETDNVQNDFREPALACATFGLLTWGMISALQHWHSFTVVNLPEIQTGRLNNSIIAACGMLSLGVLQIATRRTLRSRLIGLGSLLLGALLVCSAGADRRQSEILCVVILGCAVVEIGLVIGTACIRPSAVATGPHSVRGDA